MKTKLISILKLTVLTVAFLGMIIYMTAKPPVKVDTTTNQIQMKYMPKRLKLLDDDLEYSADSIIKENSIIVVTNHDSIAVLKDLDKYTDENIVIVTNISAAPWFIKQWVIPEKLTKLKGSSKTAWIYDENGYMKSFLKVKSDSAVVYEIFMKKDGKITKIFDGSVRQGALDGTMSEDEIKQHNLDIIAKIKKIKDAV